MTKRKLVKLFESINIGRMQVRNRLVMCPMGTRFAGEEGFVTQQLKEYYEERARGGVGLEIVEGTVVDPAGKVLARQVCAYDDKFIPGLTDLAATIKSHGARAVLQLIHGGRECRAEVTGFQAVAPSPIVGRAGDVPRELTIAEIAELVRRFAEAALRAKKAGFEGVEVHAAHAYIFTQFLSAWSNKRRDAYGGALENRARFLLEVLRAIKGAVGGDFPAWCRINGREYGIEGGITIEETQQVARWAVEAGAAAIHVSCRGIGAYNFVNCPETPGALIPLAEAVKKAVSVPVIAVGYLNPELGEDIIKEGKADLIAIGRGFLAEPEIAKKAAEGRLEDITPCIACFRCLDELIFKGQQVKCAVNAALGREREYGLTPAKKKKRVLVVGGGPAGMEAARVAALRGHQVTLYEKGGQLGGQLLQAAAPPGKGRYLSLVRYLETQLARAGVAVKLDTEVTPAMVEGLRPDAVVVAAGAVPLTPDIRGIGGNAVTMAEAVLLGKARVGKRVVVIGGNLVGCETADFLAERGHEVTVVDILPTMATDMMPIIRENFLEHLAARGVRMLTEVKDEEVTADSLLLTTKEGERRAIKADAIIIAAGSRPNNQLFNALDGKVPEVYLAGDSIQPRKVFEAIHDGARIGRIL
ncbi:MAG: FAD-dependent oxidoreductase [Chloroflexota bacterium]